MIISAKIDVTKIEKSRLFKGWKGTYLDCVIFVNDIDDQYGNRGMIVQSVTKEEKASGVRGNILGNIKVIGGQKSNQAIPDNVSRAETPPNMPQQTDDDNLPF